MSASSTPTARPRAASAAARLTVTDDLPTPPLPEEMATTLVVGATERLLVALGDVEAGPLHRPLALLGRHLVPPRGGRRVDAGQAADAGPHVALELGPQRAAGGREGQGDDDVRRRGRPRRSRTMPRSTTSLPSSGSMTPRSASRTASGGGGRWRRAPPDTTGAGRVFSGGGRRDPRRRGPRPPRPAQGPRRQHPLRHLPRAGPLAGPARHGRGGRHRSASTSTPCAPTSSGCARSGCSTSPPTTGARPGGPSTGTRSPPSAPSLGLEPPTFPAARPDAARRAPRGPAPAPTTPPPPAASRARSEAAAVDPTACRAPTPSSSSSPGSASTRRRSTTTARSPSASPTARSASWPRPTLTLVCGLHRGLVEGFVDTVGGAEVVEFRDPRRPAPVPGHARPTGSSGAHDHADRHRGLQGQGPHRGRGRGRRSWPSGSPCAPAVAPASPTRCSSTPRSQPTT